MAPNPSPFPPPSPPFAPPFPPPSSAQQLAASMPRPGFGAVARGALPYLPAIPIGMGAGRSVGGAVESATGGGGLGAVLGHGAKALISPGTAAIDAAGAARRAIFGEKKKINPNLVVQAAGQAQAQAPPANDDLNRAMNDLNIALDAAGITGNERSMIFDQIFAIQEQGQLTDMIVREYIEMIEAPAKQQEQLDKAEDDYNAQIASQESQRQDALSAAIDELKGERGKQNLTANARSMALQNWAQGIIGGVGGGGSQGMDQTAAFAGNLPAGMQDTGRAMAAQPWEQNTAVGNAYKAQLAAMTPFSPVLNPALDPNYGQPYTDAITQLVMQRANAPQYPMYQPPEQDPYAQIYANAAQMQAEAAMMNAQSNTGAGGGTDEATAALMASLGLG